MLGRIFLWRGRSERCVLAGKETGAVECVSESVYCLRKLRAARPPPFRLPQCLPSCQADSACCYEARSPGRGLTDGAAAPLAYECRQQRCGLRRNRLCCLPALRQASPTPPATSSGTGDGSGRDCCAVLLGITCTYIRSLISKAGKSR